MYRKYLDSEITFDELGRWVLALVGPVDNVESGDELQWELPNDVKMYEPVSCNHMTETSTTPTHYDELMESAHSIPVIFSKPPTSVRHQRPQH